MILRRYILRSLVGPFLLGFGVVTFLLTMDMLLDLLDLIISKGIDVWTVTQLFVLALGWIVALSIPCAVLVSALMTYGRLSQDNEIIALRASGVHLWKVIGPALGLSVIVAGGLTLFNNYVLPETNYAYSALMQEIGRKRPTFEIREGVLINSFEGYDLWIGRLDDRSGAMKDVLILDGRSDPRSPRTILARSGTLQYRPESHVLTLILHDGEIHEVDPHSSQGEYRRLLFQTQTMNITDSSDRWAGTGRHRRGQREMSVPAMKVEVLRLRHENVRQDSLIAVQLASLPVRDLEELDQRAPDTAPTHGLKALLGAVAWLRPKPPPPPAETWTPLQRRTIELIRTQQHDRRQIERQISEYQVEIHKKFSIPVACIAFVLVGAPLGIMARRGGMAAAFFSVVFFIFYWACLIGGESLADRKILSPWLAMWLPNIFLGGLGLYLSAQALFSGQSARPRRQVKPV